MREELLSIRIQIIDGSNASSYLEQRRQMEM